MNMSWLIRAMEDQAPRATLALRAQSERRRGEPDLDIAIRLAKGARTTIDIGANRGVYTHWFSRQSQRCVAFEPNPQCAGLLRRAIGGRAEVHEVALSDRDGHARLTIPIVAGRENSYRSSLEAAPGAGHRSVTVQTATLDSYTLPEVDFIKIDVEGHELEAIEGAMETIIRHRPTLLIEAEERHRTGSVAEVRQRFVELGYRGFFVYGDGVSAIEDFRLEAHQVDSGTFGARSATYVNNFFFVPPHRSEQIEILEALR